jgi:hypothetical protein
MRSHWHPISRSRGPELITATSGAPVITNKGKKKCYINRRLKS